MWALGRSHGPFVRSGRVCAVGAQFRVLNRVLTSLVALCFDMSAHGVCVDVLAWCEVPDCNRVYMKWMVVMYRFKVGDRVATPHHGDAVVLGVDVQDGVVLFGCEFVDGTFRSFLDGELVAL
jgi:hypothetical protein